MVHVLDGSNLLRVSHIHVLVIEEFVHKQECVFSYYQLFIQILLFCEMLIWASKKKDTSVLCRCTSKIINSETTKTLKMF